MCNHIKICVVVAGEALVCNTVAISGLCNTAKIFLDVFLAFPIPEMGTLVGKNAINE